MGGSFVILCSKKLARSVFSSMQNYWAHIFPLSKKFKTVESVCRRFLWSGNPEEGRKAPVAWNNCSWLLRKIIQNREMVTGLGGSQGVCPGQECLSLRDFISSSWGYLRRKIGKDCFVTTMPNLEAGLFFGWPSIIGWQLWTSCTLGVFGAFAVCVQLLRNLCSISFLSVIMLLQFALMWLGTECVTHC